MPGLRKVRDKPSNGAGLTAGRKKSRKEGNKIEVTDFSYKLKSSIDRTPAAAIVPVKG